MLSIKNLSLSKKKNILTQISLEIPSGAITLFLGKSGSGKTTLLRCIAQLEKNYEGEITLAQKPLAAFTSKERSQTIGFVPQAFALFPHMTVLENCTAPLRHLAAIRKSDAQASARQILSSLDMQPLAAAYPHELSGGQQQRAAIARALLLNPRYLLLDEPTSALDPENTQRLTNILFMLREQGIGLIISSQDMAFAKEIYDRAIFLEDGKIIEQCGAKAAFTAESKLRYYLGAYKKSGGIYSDPLELGLGAE